ncbi:hypothetical protein [Streptomyces sp. NPDC002671]
MSDYRYEQGAEPQVTESAAQPSADDACVLTVIDRSTGQSAEIDLSDEQHAHLFG